MRRFLLAAALLALPIQAAAATLTLDVQPVSICSQSYCTPADFGRKHTQRIWAQAGIELNFLRTYKTDPLAVSTDSRGNFDPFDAIHQYALWEITAGTARPGTAYMGFLGPLTGRSLGIAFVNPPGAYVLPYGMAEPQVNRRFTSAVVAHELGHILGVGHQEGGTLMAPTISALNFRDWNYVPALNPETAAHARTSPLLRPAAGHVEVETPWAAVTAVPLVPSAASLSVGVLLLLRMRRS